MADEPDRGNAHVRRERGQRKRGEQEEPRRREQTDVKAAEAQRLLDDPAFVRAREVVREGLLTELEAIKHDGQSETDAYEREICRALRTLKSVTRAIQMTVQGQKLRLADFRPQAAEEEAS